MSATHYRPAGDRGGMLHGLFDNQMDDPTSDDWEQVTCQECLGERTRLEALAAPVAATEVAVTVPTGLTEGDLEGMGDAERLGLIVGASYGAALADRDQARSQVAILGDALTTLDLAARAVLALDSVKSLTWAQDERTVDTLRQAVEDAGKALESVQAPETEEGTS